MAWMYIQATDSNSTQVYLKRSLWEHYLQPTKGGVLAPVVSQLANAREQTRNVVVITRSFGAGTRLGSRSSNANIQAVWTREQDEAQTPRYHPHLPDDMCTYYWGGASHHGEQHRRRREPVARRRLATAGGRYGADRLPLARCGPAAELLLTPFIATSVDRRAEAGIAGPDNGACHSSFHVRRGGPRTTECCCCRWRRQWRWWRRRRCTGRRYALKARARRVRDGGRRERADNGRARHGTTHYAAAVVDSGHRRRSHCSRQSGRPSSVSSSWSS